MKPSRWFYGFAVLVFLVGAGLAARSIVHALDGVRNAQRVVMPGSGEVTLSAPGTYTLFYEYRSVVGETAYLAPDHAALRVTVTARDTGERVPVTSGWATSRYSVPGHAGVSLAQVRVDRPGVYRIEAAYQDGHDGPRFVLAVGRGAALGLIRNVFVGLGAGLGGSVLALVIAAVVYVRRRKASRRPSGGWSPVAAAA